MSTTLTNFSENSIPENNGDEDVWGPLLITSHSTWDRALGGRHQVSTTGGTTTLSATEGQNALIEVSGTLASAGIIEVPASRYRRYWVYNGTAGDYTLTVRTAGGAVGVVIPRDAYQCVGSFGTSVKAFGAPMAGAGGFPDSLRVPGGAYNGPGMFFDGNRSMGFANRGSGVLGVGLLGSAAGDQVRFYGGNGTTNPLIAMTPPGTSNYDSGFRVVTGATVRAIELIVNGSARGRVREGWLVGEPGGGDQGTGTINAQNGIYSGGTRVAEIRELTAISLTAADDTVTATHGLGAKPRFVQVWLRNLTPQHGFIAGEDTLPASYQTTSDSNDAWSVWKSATEVGFNYNDLHVITKTGVSSVAITPANWAAVFLVSL